MAEFVELRSEEWLPELEQMERIRLFDSKEIKSIIKKKKQFEYKIQRKAKCKEDFLKYIQFEVDLQRLIKARRNKMKIHSSKATIEGPQTNRISRLFKHAIYRYQEDVKLWMSFFKYCLEAGLEKLGSQMLVRMLQVHADKEKLWSFAAKWDCEHLNSIETARQFLLRGIRHHPNSELLYTELFKLELKYANDKRKEEEMQKNSKMDNNSDMKNLEDVLSGKLIDVVYESAVTKIKNVDFKVNLLKLATEYSETTSLQNKIFQHLLKEHSEEEATWDTMAKRELYGISYEDPDATKRGEPMQVDLEKEMESKTLKGRIQRSVDVYEGAVKKLNTTKMWSYYIELLIELNKNFNSLTVFKSKLLRNALEGALAGGHLAEKYYLHWIDMLQTNGKPKKLSEVLTKATEHHPQSLKLWHARLRFLLTRDQENLGAEVFKEATEKISNPVDSLPIWKLLIQYYTTKSSAKVEETFKDGLKRGGELALRLKPMYLNWVAVSKGIGCAKKLFETPEMQHPPCLELLNEMISLETMQPDLNKKMIRRCHETACNLAGKDNLDVWIAYIEFELKYGDSDSPFFIYDRAVNSLAESLVNEFIARYNALKLDS